MKAATAAVDYVVKNGKRTAVILPIDEYEELCRTWTISRSLRVGKMSRRSPWRK
jgi:hypothetical protein